MKLMFESKKGYELAINAIRIEVKNTASGYHDNCSDRIEFSNTTFCVNTFNNIVEHLKEAQFAFEFDQSPVFYPLVIRFNDSAMTIACESE